MNKTVGVILAAGEGTRMKSVKAKVLHHVCNQPILTYVIAALKEAGIERICAVVGHQQDDVKKVFGNAVEYAVQKQLLGTGDAVKQALPFLEKEKEAEHVLVLSGDAPLIKSETLRQMLEKHVSEKLACTMLTGVLKDPTGYGRVIRKGSGDVSKIIEEKDASIYEKVVEEVNSGTYCFEKKALVAHIEKLGRTNAQKEYYLPDLIGIFASEGLKVDTLKTEDTDEILGINSRRDLAKVEKAFQRRINLVHMENGVTLEDPETIFIDPRVTIGADTVIHPFTVIEGAVEIGRFCEIGPFTHLRPGTILEDEAEIGNFTEVKKSKIGKKTKAKHLSYLGDAVIGAGVNVGAGTITANYDGKAKYVTVIEDGAFIGSNCTLVAPVKVGKRAYTGAGSVVTRGHDVPDDTVVVGVPARPLKKEKKK